MEVTSTTSAISVSRYAAEIGRILRSVGPAVIEGEVQRPKSTSRGMLFFDITDGEACLSCKVFPRDAGRLGHMPAHGDLVQVIVDRPDFWQQKGSLSLIVSDVRLTGEGELLRRREELLKRLRTEGLCDPDRRKRLPPFPRAVGVIAGRGSDGLSDVIQALRDRFPPVHIVTCAATVQGKAAPRDLIDALARLQEHPLVDVIVVARGGGSVQDLVAFDDEGLCRAIFACEKPIVTAIGHTDNVPVCNHVAWSAFTPSRSAEMVVPSADDLRERIAGASRGVDGLVDRLERSAERLHAAQVALTTIARRMPSYEKVALAAAPLEARAQTYFRDLRRAVEEEGRRIGECESVLTGVGDHVAELCRRLEVGTRRQLADHLRDYGHALERLVRETGTGVNRRLADSRRRYRHLADVIEARDFRRRGWAMATGEDGAGVTSVDGLRSGSRLRLTFSDGAADASVDRVLPDGKETE